MSNSKFDKEFQKGLAFREKGKYRDALKSLKKAMDIDDKNPEVWFQFAEIMTILGKDIEAMKFYWLIKGTPGKEGLDPDNINAWINEANILMKHELYKEAGKVYEAMLERFPDNIIAVRGKEEASYELANVKYCTSCGKRLGKNEKFCLKCGKSI
ncbi:hypothetical protein ES707_20350 [subsurface metagenome]